jgi:hypothetical protein
MSGYYDVEPGSAWDRPGFALFRSLSKEDQDEIQYREWGHIAREIYESDGMIPDIVRICKKHFNIKKPSPTCQGTGEIEEHEDD